MCSMGCIVVCITCLRGWYLITPSLSYTYQTSCESQDPRNGQPSCFRLIIPPHNEVVGGYTGFTPSVRPSVRPSRMPCPLCIIYSYGWILFILGANDHYHERVCRAPWPLTLTYIFKVIRPWLRKSCPLCSVYSSGWILSIFGTNDHYH